MGLLDGEAWWDNYMHFMRCEDCGATKYEFQETNYMTCERCGGYCGYRHDDFEKATADARSARFEHGETPNTH